MPDITGFIDLDNPLKEVSKVEMSVDGGVTWGTIYESSFGPEVVGILADFTNGTFTRLASAEGKSAGSDFDVFTPFGGRRRCCVSDDGTINAYYGDPGYVEDGTNGQVMVYQPKFYYMVKPLELEPISTGIGNHIRKAEYYVSSVKYPGFKLHPVFYDRHGRETDYVLFSAYEGSMWSQAHGYINDNFDSTTYVQGDLLCSLASTESQLFKPISGLTSGNGTKTVLESMANSRGVDWHLDTVKSVCANQLLMLIEFGMFNSQSGMSSSVGRGRGVVDITDDGNSNCSSYTGSTSVRGNNTGFAPSTVNNIGFTDTTYTNDGKISVSYRGVENPWGNIWKHIQGLNIWGNGSMAGGQPYIADGLTDFSESKNSGNYKTVGFTLPVTSAAYITAFGYGNPEFDWVLLPSESNANSAYASVPVGDRVYFTSKLNGYRVAMIGGACNMGTNSGAFCLYAGTNINTGARNIGGRLFYVPTYFPSEYQEVQYIESDGTQWIDTGITPDATKVYDFDLTFAYVSQSPYGSIFSSQSGGSSIYCVRLRNLESRIDWLSGGEVSTVINPVIYDNKYYLTLHYEDKNNQLTMGSISLTHTHASFSSLTAFTICSNKPLASDYSYPACAKIYSCKMKVDGVLVRNFVPCYRKSDNVAGLLDMVSNIFYVSSGPDNFIAGPNI